MRRSLRFGALAAGLLLAPLSAPALDILMSNDDVDILRGYENDPRVARWLVEHAEAEANLPFTRI